MKTPIGRKLSAGLLALAVVLAVPVYAAKHGGPGMMDGKGAGMGGPGSQQMSGMMHDMSMEMDKMSEQMSKGGMGADTQKQTAKRMKQMATMMDNMSGMMGKGMMMDAGMQKQMDEMMKGSSTPAKK